MRRALVVAIGLLYAGLPCGSSAEEKREQVTKDVQVIIGPDGKRSFVGSGSPEAARADQERQKRDAATAARQQAIDAAAYNAAVQSTPATRPCTDEFPYQGGPGRGMGTTAAAAANATWLRVNGLIPCTVDRYSAGPGMSRESAIEANLELRAIYNDREPIQKRPRPPIFIAPPR